MASSLARFRDRLKPHPEKVSACVYTGHGRDTTRDEKFPSFTKDLYFSVFPAPIKDRSINDDREIDHTYFMEYLGHLGSGRLGEHYTVLRRDLNPYAATAVPKKDMSLAVAMTKMDAARIDYVDAVRALEPFTLIGNKVSPFICKVLLSFRSRQPYMKEHYYMVSEYWRKGVSLCKRLQEVGRFSEKEVKFYAAELVDAISFIHKRGKIFRRLSLCNVLIEPTGHLKLTPYTMCDQNLDCGQPCNMLVKNCGDQFYASPEVVFGVDVQFAADWWSLGVIVFQFLTGTLPFNGRTLGELGKAITEQPVCIPNCLSGEACALIKQLLCKDPRRRLGFSEVDKVEQGILDVKGHPFFHGLLWRDVTNRLQVPPFVPLEIPLPPSAVFRQKTAVANQKKECTSKRK